MARDTSPAFQFYVRDWRSSRGVQRMTFDQRGRYLEMLIEEWERLSLPDDPRAVAELIGGEVEGWIAAWPILRRKFCDRRGRPRQGDDISKNHADPASWDANKYIINAKLENLRREKRRYTKASKVGGARRAETANRNVDGTYSDNAQPAVVPAPTPAEKPAISSTASATAFATATAFASATALVPRNAGKERPLALPLLRVKVWRSMLERWGERLGGLDFDFDAWLSQVDAEIEGLVLPKDGHGWYTFLDARFDAELVRLRVPAVRVPQLGKSNTRLAAALASIDAEVVTK